MRPASMRIARVQKVVDHPRVVADDEHGVPGGVQLPVALLTPGAKSGIADRKNLVENQHLAHGMKRDRVGETGGHPARIVLQLQMSEALELGERKNLVEARRDARQASAP